MAVLVDTGVLLRAFDANSSHYRAIRQALRKALDDGEGLFVTVQNIAEFWNVATRPLENNGHGLSVERVKRRVLIVERLCQILSEDKSSYAEWKRLAEELAINGVAVHDARLVSVMLSAGLTQILTLNDRDFKRYVGEGISILTPESYLNSVR